MQREVKEESGLTQFSSIQFLGETTFFKEVTQEMHHRHYYQLHFEEDGPDFFQHIVTGHGEDENLVFDYYWVQIDELPALIAKHDEMVDSLKIKR